MYLYCNSNQWKIKLPTLIKTQFRCLTTAYFLNNMFTHKSCVISRGFLSDFPPFLLEIATNLLHLMNLGRIQVMCSPSTLESESTLIKYCRYKKTCRRQPLTKPQYGVNKAFRNRGERRCWSPGACPLVTLW